MKDVIDWIIPISAAERAAGRLKPQTDEAVHAALDKFGCVMMRGLFAVEAIDAMRAAFDARYARFSREQMEEQSRRPPPNPVFNVGDWRYEITVKLAGPFGDPNLFANPILRPFMASVLGDNMQFSGMSVVCSYPGSTTQHIHTDHPLLFHSTTGISPALPNYAINASIPLIDVTQEMGTTAIWLGSHRWTDMSSVKASDAIAIEFKRGDCILTDYRTLHCGLPNTSSTARPILYMVYARPWFFDEKNHRERLPLDMAFADYRRLDDDLRNLMIRVRSEHVRAAQITGIAPAHE